MSNHSSSPPSLLDTFLSKSISPTSLSQFLSILSISSYNHNQRIQILEHLYKTSVVSNVSDNKEILLYAYIINTHVLTYSYGNIERYSKYWIENIKISLYIIDNNNKFIMKYKNKNQIKYIAYLTLANYLYHCRPEIDHKYLCYFTKLNDHPDSYQPINSLAKSVISTLNIDGKLPESNALFPPTVRAMMLFALFIVGCFYSFISNSNDRMPWLIIAIGTSGLCLDAVLGAGTDFSAATMYSPLLHINESTFLLADEIVEDSKKSVQKLDISEKKSEKQSEKHVEKETKPEPEIKSPKPEIKSPKVEAKAESEALPKVEVKLVPKVESKVEAKKEVHVAKPKKVESKPKETVQLTPPEDDNDDFFVIAKKKTKKVATTALPAVAKVENKEKLVSPLKVTPIEVLSLTKPVVLAESVKTDKGATLSKKPIVSEFFGAEKVPELGEIVSPFKINATVEKPVVEKPVVEKGNTFGSKKVSASSFDQLMQSTLNQSISLADFGKKN